MNFCVKCALFAGVLTASGQSPVYKNSPYRITVAEVAHARESLCRAARFERDSGDELIEAALGEHPSWRDKSAMGMALVDYLSEKWNERECMPPMRRGRIADLLHQHPGEPEGS
jgi:hypothetical protein